MADRAWIESVRQALDREFGDKPRVVVLATVELNVSGSGNAMGEPRARCVICRRIDELGNLAFVSDARSEKNAQVRQTPVAEAVFWLPSQRLQYRVRGTVSIDGETSASPDRTNAWTDLSDPSRALFCWPPPGADRAAADSAFAKAISAQTPIPANFELLTLIPTDVELLDLTEHPHRRLRWSAADAWQPRLLNP